MPEHVLDDSDSQALRRVVADGSDMSQPMLIDFHVSLPDEFSTQTMAAAAVALGYVAEVVADGNDRWTCWCSTRMLATYDGVIAVQKELAEVSARYGGDPDGWGTSGNRATDSGAD